MIYVLLDLLAAIAFIVGKWVWNDYRDFCEYLEDRRK